MSNTADHALKTWLRTHKTAQEAAATALQTACPQLERLPLGLQGCCPVKWNLDLHRHGGGDGTVHLDDESRVTLELTGPSWIIADTLDVVFGRGWFTGNDIPLREAPGQWGYDDDDSTEYEITLADNGPGTLYAGYMMLPHAVQLLDALHVRLAIATDNPAVKKAS